MSRIITFRDTHHALVAGDKTVTRRDWKRSYANRFRQGEILQAYDKTQRAGGRKIGDIQLTAYPALEPNRKITDEDYILEGFNYYQDHLGHFMYDNSGFRVPKYTYRTEFDKWRKSDGAMWVVRFKVLALDYFLLPRGYLREQHECPKCATWQINLIAYDPLAVPFPTTTWRCGHVPCSHEWSEEWTSS